MEKGREKNEGNINKTDLRRRKGHNSDQSDSDKDSDDSNQNLSQLVLQGLSQINASLAITCSLTAMNHSDGSDPSVCTKWLKYVDKLVRLTGQGMW